MLRLLAALKNIQLSEVSHEWPRPIKRMNKKIAILRVKTYITQAIQFKLQARMNKKAASEEIVTSCGRQKKLDIKLKKKTKQDKSSNTFQRIE